MASNHNDGIYNSAYHDSETLEIDRGYQSRPSSRLNNRPSRQNSAFHRNPYDETNDEIYQTTFPNERDWRGAQQNPPPMNNGPMDMDYNMQIPRYPPPKEEPYRFGQYNPTFQPELGDGPPYIIPDKDTDSMSDTQDGVLRKRSRRHTILPGQLMRPSFIAKLDPALGKQIDYSNRQEKEKLIAELVEMPAAELAKELRKFPICLKEKRELRNQVMSLKEKSSKDVSQMNCCSGCTHSINMSFRKFKQGVVDVFEVLSLWHGTLKVIEGKFGSSILSYFIFLKWLLMFNIFSFVVNFSFITIPQFIDMGPNNLTFSGLELLTGAGYFEDTVLYYGFYTNSTINKESTLAPYDMQLAYIFTIGLYLSICFLILLFSSKCTIMN